MVKTDDYMEGSAGFDIKEKEEDASTDGNWLPRSKSAGLKYVEYESDESGRIPNSTKMMASVDGDLDDRRMRRQIANCNERRRMQSINAGFQALRQLLPRKDGDKMSKASILAATAEFIRDLLHERNKLLSENASAAKRRRLDIGEQNGAPTMDEVNIVECIKTIGELRELLQKETKARMNYERELLELRNKLRSFSSPVNSDFSPNSSTSSVGDNRSLLIELAARQQESQLYCPTPIAPSEMNILSSAIASLAKNPPPGVTQPTLLNTPIGINTQQAFTIPPIGQSNNGSSLFVGVGQQQRQQANTIPNQQQVVSALQESENGGINRTSISQRNLQALVLAIRHLEGVSPSGNNGNLLVR